MKHLKLFLIILVIVAVFGGGIYTFFKFVLPNPKTQVFLTNMKNQVGILKDSGITGDEYTFDETMYPYYYFLSDDGKKLYSQVYANALEIEKNFVPIVEVTTEEVKNVINAVYHDHPELFWMDSGYTYKYAENNICVHVTLHFNETADNIEESRRLFFEKANRIIESANLLNSDYEKEKFVYHTIIEMVDYDVDAQIHQSPYSALVNGKSVCAGYARAFQYIMIELGIPTYYCAGQSEGHAWNIVKLENGYYNVDLTWADRNQEVDIYLNRTDDSLDYTHRRSGYSVLLPKCNAKKYETDSR